MMVFITHCTDCGESLEVEDEESDQFVTPYDEYTGEYGKPTSTHVCEPCKTKRARVSLERLRDKTLRDAAPVPQTDEHGFSDEERAHLEENLGHRPQFNIWTPGGFEDEVWQQKNAGEPMDIAWQLLKAAFFTPKSGYRDEKNYPKRAGKKPPSHKPGHHDKYISAQQRRDFDRKHFWNRIGVAGNSQRAAKFRESLPGSAFYTEDEEGKPVTHSVQSNAMWPSDEGEEGVSSAGRRYWGKNKMRNLLIPPRRRPKPFSTEGTRTESNEQMQARHEQADKLIEQMGLTQRIRQEGAGSRVEMRPGWQHGAGGRKEETAVGDEAWDKMGLPKGMEDIQEGHEGPDDWWKTGEPIDWRGEGEA